MADRMSMEATLLSRDCGSVLPVPTAIGAAFWKAAARKELVAQRCHDCHRFFFRPEVACLHCFSTAWSWERCAGTGSLYSYTIVYRAANAAFTTPYVLGIVDVDEGFPMFSNVVGCLTTNIKIGMRLMAVFAEVAPGIRVPRFAPLQTGVELPDNAAFANVSAGDRDRRDQP
jgi:uncharacterized OB-fold protein